MGRSVPTTPNYRPQQGPNVISNNWQSWPDRQPRPPKPAPLVTGQRTMPGGPRALKMQTLGQPKIQKLRVAAPRDKDVQRLEVAVDNRAFVCCLESVGDLESEMEKCLQIQRPTANLGCQRLAFEQLHGDKALSILLSNVINGANVWMVQGGGSFSFALESSDGLGIAGKLIGQELQGNEAVKPRVLGFVDDTHTAAAQLLDDAVVQDGLTDELGRRGHWREWYVG